MAAGAGARPVSGFTKVVCQWGGRLSYPLYLVHFPFIGVFANWVRVAHPSLRQAAPVMGALVLGFLLLSWVALFVHDEPLRAQLSAHFRKTMYPNLPITTAFGAAR